MPPGGALLPRNGEPVSGLPLCTSPAMSVQSSGLDAPTTGHGMHLHFNLVQLITECVPQSDPVLKLVGRASSQEKWE